MRSLWSRALAGLAALGLFLVAWFRVKGKQAQAEAERDRLRAQVAEAGQAARQRADDAQRQAQRQHAEERADIDAGLSEGRRDQLEGKW